MSPELATFPTFKSLPTVLSLGSTVEVEFIATTENKCFTLKNITRETKLLLSLEYSFEGLSVPNHYRFFGGYETK
ncbi:MAG: hypothetical protein MJ195_01895 [Mycoplasmoidaceae bacterium]|nr:hypothetical protein [Mycoplasmoidaceae bacterium]